MCDIETQLLALLNTQQPAVDLRQNDPGALQERSVLPIPAEDQANNFTVGTLGEGTAGTATRPAVLTSRARHAVVAAFHIGRGLTGHVGFAHGGAIATILDECCGRACLSYFQSGEAVQDANAKGDDASKTHHKSAAVTARLSVTYIAPVPIDALVLVSTEIDRDASKGRKATALAKMWVAHTDGAEKTLVAEGSGLFVDPKSLVSS